LEYKSTYWSTSTFEDKIGLVNCSNEILPFTNGSRYSSHSAWDWRFGKIALPSYDIDNVLMNGVMREINTDTKLIIDWISTISAYQTHYYAFNLL
jgi:hypothetical protein